MEVWLGLVVDEDYYLSLAWVFVNGYFRKYYSLFYLFLSEEELELSIRLLLLAISFL